MSGGPDHLQQIYKLLGCQLITPAALSDHDSIYCDDEGLIKGPVYQFFGVRGYPQPLAGRGLVVGIDDDGNDEAPRLTLEEVKARTYFIERLTKDAWSMRGATTPNCMEIGHLQHVVTALGGEASHG